MRCIPWRGGGLNLRPVSDVALYGPCRSSLSAASDFRHALEPGGDPVQLGVPERQVAPGVSPRPVQCIEGSFEHGQPRAAPLPACVEDGLGPLSLVRREDYHADVRLTDGL